MADNREKVHDILSQLRLDITVETVRVLREGEDISDVVLHIESWQNRLDRMITRATDDIERLYEYEVKT